MLQSYHIIFFNGAARHKIFSLKSQYTYHLYLVQICFFYQLSSLHVTISHFNNQVIFKKDKLANNKNTLSSSSSQRKVNQWSLRLSQVLRSQLLPILQLSEFKYDLTSQLTCRIIQSVSCTPHQHVNQFSLSGSTARLSGWLAEQ